MADDFTLDESPRKRDVSIYKAPDADTGGLPLPCGTTVKDRDQVLDLLNQLLNGQSTMQASQDHLLCLTARHAETSPSKDQVEDLLVANRQLTQEVRTLQRFVQSMSIRSQFRRLSLVGVCFAGLLTVLTIASGGELVFHLRLAGFLLAAGILLFVIASLAPHDEHV